MTLEIDVMKAVPKEKLEISFQYVDTHLVRFSNSKSSSSISGEIIAPVGNASSTDDSVKYGKTANVPPFPTIATMIIANKDLFMYA